MLPEGGGLEIIEKAKGRLRELEEEEARVKLSWERGWRTEGEVELRLRAIAEKSEYHQEQLDRAEVDFGELPSQVEILESLGNRKQRWAAWKSAFRSGREQLLKTVLKQATIKEDGEVEYRGDLDAVAELSNTRRCS